MAHTGLDLGNVLQTAENIKGSRITNQLNQQTFDANILAQQGSNQFNALLQQHFANPTPETFNAIAAANPEIAGQLQGLQSGRLDIEKQRRDARKLEAQGIVKDADIILSSAAPLRRLQIVDPEFIENLRENGGDVSQLTDDVVRQMMKDLRNSALSDATAGDTTVAPKSASFKTFRSTEDPTKTITVDLTDPESVAPILANPGGFVPIAEEVITGTRAEVSPLGRKAEGSVQTDIIALEDSFARVAEIGKDFEREFLTFQGRIRFSVSSLLDKANVDITPEERDFIKSRKKFVTKVNREFNLYRKLITGAAAAEKELNDLKKATINEDLGPIEFEAALEVYQEELFRGLRLKRALLRNGIRLGTDEFGETFDTQFLSGNDDDADVRLQELLEDGLDIDAATDRLIEEGYE